MTHICCWHGNQIAIYLCILFIYVHEFLGQGYNFNSFLHRVLSLVDSYMCMHRWWSVFDIKFQLRCYPTVAIQITFLFIFVLSISNKCILWLCSPELSPLLCFQTRLSSEPRFSPHPREARRTQHKPGVSSLTHIWTLQGCYIKVRNQVIYISDFVVSYHKWLLL